MYDELVSKDDVFEQPVSRQIWDQKYRYRSGREIRDQSLNATFRRVAVALAEDEPVTQRSAVADQFYDAMQDFRLIPGGRILAGAGTTRKVTLCNTFVMPAIEDSVEGILQAVSQAAVTMKMGGGVGFDFSTIRPRGSDVAGLDCPAAGPLAAMDLADAMCRMIVTGMGRGAMMAALACDHPDIEDFITAKSDPGRFRSFNLSVLVSDAFIAAVDGDADWDLAWNGASVRRIKARTLWQKIVRQTYEAAEPGVLFIDRINAANPLAYLERVSATNSCAEQPLPANGACPLASINLARLVTRPFTQEASFDMEGLARLATLGVRLLDNVVDLTAYPFEAQRIEALSKRRIGLGITGLADAFAMLGLKYGAPGSLEALSAWMRCLKATAYEASADLAAKRGAFPLFRAKAHLTERVMKGLPPVVAQKIRDHGLRNGVLTSVAPTGTTSMFAGNVSSGIEPIFATSYKRTITGADGVKTLETVMDYAAQMYRDMHPDRPLPEAFVTANDLTPEAHVAIQATAQAWVDAGISKTVNCPEDIAFDDFARIYRQAYDAGCKGCTTFRPNAITGSILSE